MVFLFKVDYYNFEDVKELTQDSWMLQMFQMLQNVSFSKILLAQVFNHHMQHLNNTVLYGKC